jgi:hypothetical protein
MSTFEFDEAALILGRTPKVLDVLLRRLPDPWIDAEDDGGGWSSRVVVAHLIHGEVEDWIPRVKIILQHGGARTFKPFQPELAPERARGRSMDSLLDEFARCREESLRSLANMKITEVDLDRIGRHPAFGRVTLRELLATWVVHDLGHVRQIARAMANHYRDDVGAWRAYLPVIGERARLHGAGRR